jgi:hypothetical protein
VRPGGQEPLSGAKLPDTEETDETAETKRETKEHVRALQITAETPGSGLLIRRFRVRIPGGALGRIAGQTLYCKGESALSAVIDHLF